MLCRVRPLLSHEAKSKRGKSSAASTIRIQSQHKLVVSNANNKEQSFQFDRVFEPSVS